MIYQNSKITNTLAQYLIKIDKIAFFILKLCFILNQDL